MTEAPKQNPLQFFKCELLNAKLTVRTCLAKYSEAQHRAANRSKHVEGQHIPLCTSCPIGALHAKGDPTPPELITETPKGAVMAPKTTTRVRIQCLQPFPLAFGTQQVCSIPCAPAEMRQSDRERLPTKRKELVSAPPAPIVIASKPSTPFAAKPTAPTEPTCKQCGKSFTPPATQGRRPVYCSSKCRSKAGNERFRGAAKAAATEHFKQYEVGPATHHYVGVDPGVGESVSVKVEVPSIPVIVDDTLPPDTAKIVDSGGKVIGTIVNIAPAIVQCDHTGIGKPGCETCDPRTNPDKWPHLDAVDDLEGKVFSVGGSVVTVGSFTIDPLSGLPARNCAHGPDVNVVMTVRQLREDGVRVVEFDAPVRMTVPVPSAETLKDIAAAVERERKPRVSMRPPPTMLPPALEETLQQIKADGVEVDIIALVTWLERGRDFFTDAELKVLRSRAVGVITERWLS